VTVSIWRHVPSTSLVTKPIRSPERLAYVPPALQLFALPQEIDETLELNRPNAVTPGTGIAFPHTPFVSESMSAF
jgi:hypothetical protein